MGYQASGGTLLERLYTAEMKLAGFSTNSALHSLPYRFLAMLPIQASTTYRTLHP
jgi:hypothetical protein